jgi:hypothetical protein
MTEVQVSIPTSALPSASLHARAIGCRALFFIMKRLAPCFLFQPLLVLLSSCPLRGMCARHVSMARHVFSALIFQLWLKGRIFFALLFTALLFTACSVVQGYSGF